MNRFFCLNPKVFLSLRRAIVVSEEKSGDVLGKLHLIPEHNFCGGGGGGGVWS